jgi:hypothetical protein
VIQEEELTGLLLRYVNQVQRARRYAGIAFLPTFCER